jgi:hypothetical protein
MGGALNAFKQCLGIPRSENDLVAIGADVNMETGSQNSHVHNANRTSTVKKDAHNKAKKIILNQRF